MRRENHLNSNFDASGNKKGNCAYTMLMPAVFSICFACGKMV